MNVIEIPETPPCLKPKLSLETWKKILRVVDNGSKCCGSVERKTVVSEHQQVICGLTASSNLLFQLFYYPDSSGTGEVASNIPSTTSSGTKETYIE